MPGRADRRPVAGAGAGRPGRARRGSPAPRAQRGDADPQPRRALAARPGRSSSTTSPTASTPPPATRSTPRRSTSCSPSRARWSRSASPTWRRSARSSATAATSRCCARAGRRRRDAARARRGRERRCSALVAGAARRRRSRSLAVAARWSRAAGSDRGARARRRSASASRSPIAGALAARLGASARRFAATVGEARRSVRRRATQPLWQRLYLDLLALAVSGLIYWLTARTGFSAVVNPDSNPTLSLSVYMFFAPALLWIGATLLLVRLRGRLVAWLRARAAGGRRDDAARGFLLASAGRRGAAINRGLVVVGLLLAFGVNLGIFTATYDQQARVDAQLTLGADVVVTAPPGVDRRARRSTARIARVPGVAGATRRRPLLRLRRARPAGHLRHRPGDARRARTTLRDSYFLGGSAAQMLDRLRSHARRHPRLEGDDHRLLAADSATCCRLRVLDHATGRFRVVALPRRRHRPGVPVGAARLVHGRQPRLPRAGRPTTRARTSSSQAPPATPPPSHARVAAATRARRDDRQGHPPARPRRRSARSRPST